MTDNLTAEQLRAENDAFLRRCLDPEWQAEHRRLGFLSPIADVYEALGLIPKEERDE